MRNQNRLIESVIVFFVLGLIISFAFQLAVEYQVFLDELITSETPLWEYQAFIMGGSIIAGILGGV